MIVEERHTPCEFEQPGEDRFDSLYFDSLYEKARTAGTGLVICIALYPLCTGQPFRIKYLERMLTHIMSFAGVWPATAGESAECYRTTS